MNIHLHSALTRGVTDDVPLVEWVMKLIYPKLANLLPEDAYWASMLAYAESIKSGTTCVLDMYRHMNKCSEAAEKIGIRAGLSPICFDDVPGGEKIEDNRRLFVERNGAANGRIKIWFGLEWTAICNPETLMKAREYANKFKTGIHTHFQESLEWLEGDKRAFGGKSGIEQAYYSGLLGPDVVAAHCVWLSNKDIQLLKQTGANVSHNPVSNMKFGNGVAPVPELISNGINVGLGTDGAFCNNNNDMFEVMKYASLLHKVNKLSSVVMPAPQVLQMATMNGAKALGLEKEIGSIESDKKADIILVDLNRLRMTPLLLGEYLNLISHLVYSAHGDEVDTVIIDGKVVMENRILKNIDEPELIEKSTEATENLLRRLNYKKTVVST